MSDPETQLAPRSFGDWSWQVRDTTLLISHSNATCWLPEDKASAVLPFCPTQSENPQMDWTRIHFGSLQGGPKQIELFPSSAQPELVVAPTSASTDYQASLNSFIASKGVQTAIGPFRTVLIFTEENHGRLLGLSMLYEGLTAIYDYKLAHRPDVSTDGMDDVLSMAMRGLGLEQPGVTGNQASSALEVD